MQFRRCVVTGSGARLISIQERHVSARAVGPSVAALAYGNWLLDLGSLVAALAATHANVPAQSVLLTYALAQMVASLRPAINATKA